MNWYRIIGTVGVEDIAPRFSLLSFLFRWLGLAWLGMALGYFRFLGRGGGQEKKGTCSLDRVEGSFSLPFLDSISHIFLGRRPLLFENQHVFFYGFTHKKVRHHFCACYI